MGGCLRTSVPKDKAQLYLRPNIIYAKGPGNHQRLVHLVDFRSVYHRRYLCNHRVSGIKPHWKSDLMTKENSMHMGFAFLPR